MLGILALLISWVPIVNNLAAVIAVVGLILGLLAIRSTRPTGKNSGRGLSVAGTVICALALAIVLFTQFLFTKALDEVSKENNKPDTITNTDSSASKDKKQNDSNLIAGKYLIENVQVKKIGKDHAGKPTVVVSYDITNKGDKKSNMFDVSVKIFQNKVELENALYMEAPEGYDAESFMKEILPGGKKTVTTGFVLSNEKDPVTVKIASTVDFNDSGTKITKEFPLN